MTETQAAAGARGTDAGDAGKQRAGGDVSNNPAGAPTSGPPRPAGSSESAGPGDSGSGGPGGSGAARGTARPPTASGAARPPGVGGPEGEPRAGSPIVMSKPADPGGRPPVVGRATVPGETTGSAPKFMRAPGMPPPPDVLVPAQGPGDPLGTHPISVSAVPSAQATQAVRVGPPGAPARGAASVGRAGVADSPTGSVTGSARVTEAVRAARATVSSAAGRGPRRARLHIKRIDPWSTMKFSFAVSLVLFFVAVVATSVLYLALDAMGVFDSVNQTLAETIVNSGGQGAAFRITAKGVVGGSALIGAVNVVLFTALATLGAFIYNVCADLVGGIELTLAEKD
jgi:hypothetical protein